MTTWSTGYFNARSPIWSMLRLEPKPEEISRHVVELRKQFGVLVSGFNHSHLNRGNFELHNDQYAELYNNLTDLIGHRTTFSQPWKIAFRTLEPRNIARLVAGGTQAYSEATLSR